MALVFESLVMGLTSVAIVLSSLLFGLICIVRGIRYRTKLLTIAGINVIFMGSYWLGPSVEIFAVMLLNVHLDPPDLYILLSYSQIPFGIIFMGILAGELVMPNYKGAVLGSLTCLAFIYMAGLYTSLYMTMNEIAYFPGYIINVPPDLNHIIDGYPTPYSLCLYIAIFGDFTVLFLEAGGCLIKAYQSTGLLRRKFILLAIGFSLFVFGGLSDIVIDTETTDWGIYWLAMSRSVMCFMGIFIYLGLKT
ncbi:MAG: hypothetical protein ACFFAS_17715 [Promethearchaeota archaeon]